MGSAVYIEDILASSKPVDKAAAWLRARLAPHLKIEDAVADILGAPACVTVGVPDERRGGRRALLYTDGAIAPRDLCQCPFGEVPSGERRAQPKPGTESYVGKLFFYDLRRLETLHCILSFFVLGVILVSVSWLYTRFRDRIQRYL